MHPTQNPVINAVEQLIVNKYTQFLSKRNRVLFVWKNITSKYFLISHIFWLLLRPDIRILRTILTSWPDIKKKRAIEKKEQVVTDETLFKQSKQFVQKGYGG